MRAAPGGIAPPGIMPMSPPCSCATISLSSSSSASRGFWSTSNKTCMPAFPSSARLSGAAVALRKTPSTRVTTSPGLRSTAAALRGESGAARTPLVS